MNEENSQQFDWGMWLSERLQGSIETINNRKLLWCLMRSKVWNQPEGSIEALLLEELQTRLYPEYDGETVCFEEWGWSSPAGDIRYVD